MSLLIKTLVLLLLPAEKYSAAFLENHILVRGTAQTSEFKTQVQFYANYYGLENLTIVLVFDQDLPENVNGYTLFERIDSLGVQNAYIRIQSRLDFSQQQIVLAHEMVHVQQYYLGKLIHHAHHHYTWQGKSIANIKKIAYTERAWEQEAFTWEKKLWWAYLQSQEKPENLANAYKPSFSE
ncbi:MAG: hypothetical protein HC913_15985 [Microscillaceae bacterium]|nr:hypothetical protein [Microscillaceae bacterium]